MITAAGRSRSRGRIGAGPHVDVDVRRNLALLPGVSLLGRVGGAVIIGQSRQLFHNGVVNADGSVSDSSLFVNKTEAAPVLSVEAGRLAWEAGRMPRKLYASASSPLAGVVGSSS